MNAIPAATRTPAGHRDDWGPVGTGEETVSCPPVWATVVTSAGNVAIAPAGRVVSDRVQRWRSEGLHFGDTGVVTDCLKPVEVVLVCGYDLPSVPAHGDGSWLDDGVCLLLRLEFSAVVEDE